MGKFLKFQVRNGATATSATGTRDILINVDDIASIIDGAAGANVVVALKDPVGVAASYWTLTLGTTTVSDPADTTGNGVVANVAPTAPLGKDMPSQSVNRALTANPGGISSTVQLGVDGASAPLKMYFTQAALT